MEVHEFGKENSRKILLVPGNMMCWKQFGEVIPLLEKSWHVIAASTDGYDGTGKTVFTTAEESAKRFEEYIESELSGSVDLAFGESFGSATAAMLFHRQKVKVGALIMSGPQYMNLGILTKPLAAVIPRGQYRTFCKLKSIDKLPWMLRLYTRGDDEKLLAQFKNVPANISLETLRNCTNEAMRLYGTIDSFEPRPDAKVAIWYGANEPNMKKALAKLKRAFPNAEDHPFAGFGHGEIISNPELMAKEINAFMDR